MKDHKVLVPIKDLDGIRQPGETVSLSDKDAAELIALGAVEEIARPAEPTAEERLAAITAAIHQLDPNNGDLWLRDGKPDISALAAITGWPVTAAERNAAWLTLQEPT